MAFGPTTIYVLYTPKYITSTIDFVELETAGKEMALATLPGS
jgi:hypothetical protein